MLKKLSGRAKVPVLYAGAECYLEVLKLTIDADADTTITNR
ncbi:hypothetical protein [Paenibacillus sp. NEAU-GSW1]|nr:hypothetical protein [Paenibacillus sp. NEAU-GSW1]